jgi:NitT/TauT family transport system ATP-binding protein
LNLDRSIDIELKPQAGNKTSWQEEASMVAPAVTRPAAVPVRPAFISLDGVAKVYDARGGGQVQAVETVSFHIGHGEFVSIVGPSGCGKTTLLKIIGGLLEASAGTIAYEGLAPGRRKPQLGMVFQDAVLLPWRTVLQNVCLPIEVMRRDRAEGEAFARRLIELVGLKGFEDKYPNELSGGMQQRASIARALVTEPALLLMDEPFGALDALTREYMAQELQRIWSSAVKTVLFITHSISEAVFLSDRVVVMTARPSRVAEIIAIDLARPRHMSMTTNEAFGRYVARIRTLLSATGEL